VVVARQQEARRNYWHAATPVLQDLDAEGVDSRPLLESSIGIRQLIRSKADHIRAIPVLLKWLPKVEYIALKESIVRTLSVPWAREVAPNLVSEFLSTPGALSGYKWAIGNALPIVADDSVFDDIVALARDKTHGKAREMVVLALANMKNPSAVDVLIELLGDDVVAGHALSALRKLAPVRARPFIEPFVTHPRTWWRNEAKRALAKIDKKLATGPTLSRGLSDAPARDYYCGGNLGRQTNGD
jgi:hypothetical protein